MYYVWSFILSFVIFALLQYKELCDDRRNYKLMKYENILSFFVIYLISTLASYFISNSFTTVGETRMKGGNPGIDASLLRRIPDEVLTGFTPY